MKRLLIVSTESHAGKSTLALAIGQALAESGESFSYIKPISSSVSYETGEPIDRDAKAIASVLGLKSDIKQIAPVTVETPYLQEAIESGDLGFRRRILAAFEQMTDGRDVAIIEGRQYLGLGLTVGLSDLDLAEVLEADIILVARYDGEVSIDRVLCALRLLGSPQQVLGVVFNSVSMETQLNTLTEVFSPYMDERGAEVLGIVPYDHYLHSVYIDEIMEKLSGRAVTSVPTDSEVRHFRIAATGVESAMRVFRRTPDLGVITGGDRIEIQEAALEVPSLRCIILTGNHLPQRAIVRKANEKGVAIIVAGQEPMAAASLCENLLSQSRIRPGDRLNRAISLVRSNVDIARTLEKASRD
jgi:uncharacterized protein